ncbi:MAG: hypothetical protein RBS37_02080 [Bacteroidales bacterium]|jgi:hypothetical protein|nr:hypothetical protein [Bacteroidales bacterium]
MKRPLLIVIIILVVILAYPVYSVVKWALQEKKPMNILVLNKTVPTLDRDTHRSFFWILNNERFVDREKKNSYSFRKDYYGFYPLKPLRERQHKKRDYRLAELIDLAESYDAVYFADTYGVFFSEWYQAYSRTRRTRKIYGGLNNNDQLLLSEMQKRNKLVVLEYNSFDYPTADLERYKVEEMLGIKSTGWTGKYFESLDTVDNPDFPIWMTGMYRKYYREPWTFKDAGIVFVKDREIVVLETGKHLTNPIPFVVTGVDYVEKYGVLESVPFTQWFEIIEPRETEIVSEFRLQTTAAGDSLLAQNYLSEIFPAVIVDPLQHRNYYFAGDFATNDIMYETSYLSNQGFLKKTYFSEKDSNDPRRFFWLYYKPLINTIFTDYYNTLGN